MGSQDAPGAITNVEWLAPMFAPFAAHGRVTVFDKQGTGQSDREARFTPEERMDDLRAVMDVAAIERACPRSGGSTR